MKSKKIILYLFLLLAVNSCSAFMTPNGYNRNAIRKTTCKPLVK